MENDEGIRKSRRNLGEDPEFQLLPLPSRRKVGERKKETQANTNNVDSDDDTASVMSRRSHRSKASKHSTASSHRSEKLRKQLQIEIDSMTKINDIEVEMEKLRRAKDLERKRVEMEKLIIEVEEDEANDDAASQTSRDEVVVANPEGSPSNRVRDWVDDVPVAVPQVQEDVPKKPSQENVVKPVLPATVKNVHQQVPQVSVKRVQQQATPSNLECKEESSELQQLTMTMSQLMTRQSIRRELPDFSGNPSEWIMFYQQYLRTSEVCGMSDDENMLRLQRCLKGKARDAVLPILGIPENVKVVMETLKLMFGRSDQIIETLVEKVKSTPPPKSSKPESVVFFSNQITNLVATMKALHETGHLINPTLIKETVAKLPWELQHDWCKFSRTLEKTASLEDLSTWLHDEAMTFNLMPIAVNNEPEKLNKNKKSVFSTVNKNENCSYCSKPGHEVGACEKLLADDVGTRWKTAKMNRLCYRCLGKFHRSGDCKNKVQCEADGCDKGHHKLLHKSQTVNHPNVCGHAKMNDLMKEVLLRIIPVKLSGPEGDVHTYAMLDEGSTVTLVDGKLAKRLGLSGEKKPLCIQWTNGITNEEQDSEVVSMSIAGVHEEAKQYKLFNARTLSNLALPSQTVDMGEVKRNWPYLKNVPFSSLWNAKPEILIGSDNIMLTTPRQLRQGQWNDPIATKTWLGWVVHGSLTKPGKVQSDYSFVVCDNKCQDVELNKMVQESFATESFGVRAVEKSLRSTEDEKSLVTMNDTTRRVGQRFETGLLWKMDQVVLPESKTTALRRLQCMERKMDRDQNFADEYCNKINDYIAKGYCRKLTEEESIAKTAKTWYIPHFAVYNPNKPGKLRLVFDAAARSHGAGLNDYLMKGPDLLNPLPAVLLRFRKPKVGVMGDIKEMFHQVRIVPADQDSQRFLWRGKDRNKEPETYKMEVMIFGAACSPSSALYVKDLNADEFRGEFPEGVEAIHKNMYMDDLLDGDENDEMAIRKVIDFVEVFSRGGFEICNWASSSKEVVRSLPQELRAKGLKNFESTSELSVERALGMTWNPEEDNFQFNLNYHKVAGSVLDGSKVPTKREYLQLVMSVFDPLGFVAHFVVKAKILFQHIWLSKIGWDDKLTEPQNEKWKKWLEQLKSITKVRVPRCYSFNLHVADHVDIHVFVDASEDAFAAVCYLRLKFENSVEVAFVMAKTRVAPTKRLSVPRLELQAAVMGSRMAVTVKNEIKLNIGKTHYWSDSRIVLCWIRSESRNFKQFVAHRIGEILEATEVEDWHWVPTAENVADEATRGNDDADFNPNSRWLTGPIFLKLDPSCWPKEKSTVKVELPEEEMKKNMVGVLIQIESFSCPHPQRISSWRKAVRINAWICRFICNVQLKLGGKPRILGVLTVPELKRSERIILKAAQRESFPLEIVALKSGKPLERNSRLIKLNPMIGEDGLIRFAGRTDLAGQMDGEARRPIILDSSHDFTCLLLLHYHEKCGHHGVETVLNELRQRFWVLRMRAAVKKTFYNCQYCKNQRALPIPPLMGALPVERLERQVRPFVVSGVDFFGPIIIAVGKRQEKRYGVLFTCMSVRAVHLEIAKNLSTHSAINAIRRFVARRGPVRKLMSDNATNFKGANNELKRAIKELDNPSMMAKLSEMGTSWSFNPPGAPHMGGGWERLVRSIKVALAVTLKEARPQEDLLHTLMLEAEYLVNSRPLTYVSIDPDDPESLTPNHFLLGKGEFEVPLGKFSDHDLCLRRGWRRVQRLVDIFWSRWVKEYLPTLTRRTKWHAEGRAVAVGDVVVVVDANGPRNSWPMGRIVAVFPGKDGRVRVVDVKTKDGIYRRPVTKIAVLDVRKFDEEKQLLSSGGRNVAAE